ncbi:hypothetical protein CCAX7_54630 [Capsulimonas corticalis]|uniref:Uncharacterized protein n=1 Tax=Capsulimonas corticalis TaxID=2219043 RepID=A0A402D5Z9_9BACT|nr:hypothetical protein [Capsulimonas corticalis]BDI33412.1 hypothetical protein CCAX7_54630 [Capsulimonas corticalis]
MIIKLNEKWDGKNRGDVVEVGAGVGQLLVGRGAAEELPAPAGKSVKAPPVDKMVRGPQETK